MYGKLCTYLLRHPGGHTGTRRRRYAHAHLANENHLGKTYNVDLEGGEEELHRPNVLPALGAHLLPDHFDLHRLCKDAHFKIIMIIIQRKMFSECGFPALNEFFKVREGKKKMEGRFV